MLTININKLEVNTISNIGSLNIGKAIVCNNRATSKVISPPTEAIVPAEVIAPADSISHWPVIPPAEVAPPVPATPSAPFIQINPVTPPTTPIL